MKKIDLKCPSCGGIMKVSEDKTEITCQYCKHKFLIEKEKTIEELKETGSVTKSAKILSLTPYKLYLYTDGENKSILYDVYKIKIKSNYDGKTF